MSCHQALQGYGSVKEEELCQKIFALDPILRSIFAQMSLKDVKTCRFVNLQWAKNAWSVIRTKSFVRIDSIAKLETFLKFTVPQRVKTPSKFFGFSFHLCIWNDFIALQLQHASALRLYLQASTGVQITDTIPPISKQLVELHLQKFTIKATLPLTHTYPHLTAVSVSNNGGEDVPPTFWIHLLQNAPKLKDLKISEISYGDELWKALQTPEGLKMLGKLTSLHLNVTSLPLTRLLSSSMTRILTKVTVPVTYPDLSEILALLADQLTELHFITGSESVLSPVPFPPLMPHVKLLNAGNSQLSFPTVTMTRFPQLTEIRATYWDWVYALEQTPNSYYYWWVDNPHETVVTAEIRFPSRREFQIYRNYTVLENYGEFCVRILQKFPNLGRIRMSNLESRRGYTVSMMATEFAERLRELRVLGYQGDGEGDDVKGLFPHRICSEIEIWDANPGDWTERWCWEKTEMLNFRRVFTPGDVFANLKVLKLIWIGELNLTQLVAQTPVLEELEVVGDRCIDRFDRWDMLRGRRHLKYYQHRCKCPQEDDWFMTDGNSHAIFTELFSKS